MFKQLNVLKDLKLRTKLGAIVFLMALPIVTLLYLYLGVAQRAITFAEKEILGVQYLLPLKDMFENIEQHSGLTTGYLAGSKTTSGDISRLGASIETSIQNLKTIDQQLGKTLQTTDRLNQFLNAWRTLQQNWKTLSIEENQAQHGQVIASLIELMQHAGDQSNLILDPDLDSYYLMDAVIIQLPAIVDVLGQLRNLGNHIAISKAIGVEQRFYLETFIDRVETRLNALDRGLQVAYHTRPSLEQQLAGDFNAARSDTSKLLDMVKQDFVRAQQITMVPSDYFGLATRTMNDFLSFYDNAAKRLRDVLEVRIAKEATQRNVELVVALVMMSLAVALAIYMTRFITRQVGVFSVLLTRIGEGNYQARAEVLSRDELGTMAVALNTMLDNTLTLIQSQTERDAMQNSIMKLLEEISGVADGDLSVQAEVSEDMTGAIADSFNHMIHQIRTIVANVQSATLQVSTSANEVQATTELLAEGSTVQASQIVDSSAALDEMAVSIQQVSENATLSASVAEQALSNAKEGTLSVRNTIEGMHRIRSQVQETSKRIKRLGERSQEIGEIVQLIGDIADRTSILALNASIQAARAGEAGRSFVVVAEEVERLAERAANATKQIAGLVNTIQSETNEAVTAMEESTREVVQGSQVADQAGQALSEIESVSTRLAELIQSISLAASQQARGSEGLSKAMGEISEVTQQTATGTKQAAVSIHALAGMADELRASVSTFKLPNSVNGHGRETVGAYN